MMEEDDTPTTEEIVNEYQDTPEYKLRQAEQEENLDQDQFDAQQGYGYPEPTLKENLFTFWKWFFGLKDLLKLNKTGNLSDTELFNVRLFEDLAYYNGVEEQPMIKNYLHERSSIILSTSLSKKGFGAGLVGTQVRKVQRMTSGVKEKKGWFSNKKENVTESE